MGVNPLNKAFDENGKPKPGVNKFLDHALRIQQPWVVKVLKHLRAQHPDETPEQIAKRARKLYIRSVTAGGGAVGATAAVPGIGTIASLGLSSVAVAGYLEATALYAQAMAELHGVEPQDEQQNRTMIMALMLGEDGQALMGQLLASSSASKSVSSKWGLMLGKSSDSSKRFDVGRTVRNMFIKRFLARQSGAVLGRALPFGLGAVVGGGANLAMARQVIKSADDAFGAFPNEFPVTLGLGDRAEKFEGGTSATQQEALESGTRGGKKRR
ncbi:di- and tripeptidase [Kocuria tytonis]|uniref:Di-and tripeptidase n=1 Tax=Kocuria tytonis TaxID=2054280 RepID=A0A495A536_9MICC|nr:di- and tripeptidase [Kocuria tytonis]RKQ34883.1 di- and tripeptidase [Kocuria tytonis]